jgi:O-antigen ligase
MIIQLPTIIESSSVNSEGRPYYPTLLAGGINIEVSTLSVMMIWLLYKHKAIMLLIVMALFYLTQTRAVFVSIASLFIVDKIYLNKDINKLTSKLIIGTIKYTMGLAICIWILYELNLYLSWNLEIYFQRLTSSMGDDPGSQGRLFLYITAFNSSDCFLVGCGVGVASEIIKNSNVFEFFEDNFHNVYLQQLIEVGVLGLVAYMMIFYMAIKRSLLELSDPGLAATITSIFIMGLLQFNGYEILTAFILGLGCSSNAKNVNNHYLCK